MEKSSSLTQGLRAWKQPSIHPHDDASCISAGMRLVKDTKTALQSNRLTFWTKVCWAWGSASPGRPGQQVPKLPGAGPSFLDVKLTKAPAVLHFTLWSKFTEAPCVSFRCYFHWGRSEKVLLWFMSSVFPVLLSDFYSIQSYIYYYFLII